MKTNSMDIPQRLLDLGNGHYYINFGLQTTINICDDGGKTISYDFESIEVDHCPLNDEIFEVLLQNGYSETDANLVANSTNIVTVEQLKFWNENQII